MDVQDPFNGDEDAALRYAIELSLQDVENKGTGVLSDDSSSDEDLEKRPIYPSVTKKAGNSSMQGTSKDATLATPQTAPTVTCGLSGLDRKKMEEERLARLGKRKARDEEQMIQEPRQRTTTDGTPTLEASAAIGQSASLPFPTGVIKRTWTAGYTRTGDDIKIEEVLQKDELEMAVLSSFQWDEDWLLSKVDVGKTKMLLIAFASGATQQEEMKANVPEERIKFCFPTIPYDWGETGVMENIVFLIDLPRTDTTALNRNKPTLFEEELCYFLRAQGLDEALVKSLAKYDFSATARYGGSPTAWGYVGSANLSDSAWGRLVKDKATGKPKLTCRNWECGVLVPVQDHGRTIAEGRSSPGSLSIFQDTIPIPMEVPGEAYGMSGTKRPWLFLER
ncbi:hypothetical protein DL766_005944 [Monosporascus sp. MC13-8B]|uniref:Phospholipase D-like domain-containing protein n=1 Tax=Monosporascus cannonballus TaxID=155416 RepID=A0ABY0HDG9_9PEZI|nr:hypothetical protein DL762_004048 [Monosporascus cannonballus]RYO97807.1 hypothetical protein DL763_002603 [Monosporascus cannonballus]RYP28281.1 hypothetical protein DL766_005944 [Monosporascus sp. MC13-8B]